MTTLGGKPSVVGQYSPRETEGPGGTADVARSLQYEVREGGDGDEIAEQLFQFLDYQSREMRDFLQNAWEVS